MRLDRFLKLSRLVKRRTLAKELCEEGVVFVNGTRARAGRDVDVRDRLSLRLRNRHLDVEIARIPSRPPTASAARELYRIVSDERVGIENELEEDVGA